MKRISAYLTLPFLLLLAATGCGREGFLPENELPDGTCRIEVRVAGTNDPLPESTRYMSLRYSSAGTLESLNSEFIPGSSLEVNSGDSLVISATIGGSLNMEGDQNGNSYSALKFTLPTPTVGENSVAKGPLPYLLFGKQAITKADFYALELQSPMAMLRFRMSGTDLYLYKSINLIIQDVPTTYTPSAVDAPYGGRANLELPGSIPQPGNWEAASPCFPVSQNIMTCTFVCTQADGTVNLFTVSLNKPEAGKVYDYQFGFEGKIRLNTVSVKDWEFDYTLGNSHADPYKESTADSASHTVTLNSPGSLTPSLIETAIGSGKSLVIKGRMSIPDFSTLSTWTVTDPDGKLSSELDRIHILDLSGVIELTEVPRNAFIVLDSDNTGYGSSSLKEVILPTTVTSIGESAFKACEGLTTLTNIDQVTTLGVECFLGCNSLKVFEAKGLTKVENQAFVNAGLTSFKAPKLTKIGRFAFNSTPLTELFLTAPGVIEMGNTPFQDVTTTDCVLHLNADKKADGTGFPQVDPDGKWSGCEWKEIKYEGE